ncbi:MAG: hypothetical protein LBR06_05705 [Bacteroidales bacterium]|nr:hypothetical protein [Bacteroidales bacterium]
MSESFKGKKRYFTLAIPNTEVATVYHDQISQWFDATVEQSDIPQEFVRALIAGDKETAQKHLSTMLMKSISYFDNAESYYHGFLTALFVKVGDYEVKSNRETAIPTSANTESPFIKRNVLSQRYNKQILRQY